MSEAIFRLVDIAHSLGLKSEDGQWSKAFVHNFSTPMPDKVREVGLADSTLNYWRNDGDPHNPADEGFTNRAAKVGISFPLEEQV